MRGNRMKKIFSLVIAFVMMFTISVFSARAGTDTNFDKSAISANTAQSDAPLSVSFDVVPITQENQAAEIKIYDGDGKTAISRDFQVIASKNHIISMATAEININRLKTETRKSVSNFTQSEFYDLPPNDYGYRGDSIANRCRASPA